MTVDVCDTCWGTGDADRHGCDLRKMKSDLLSARRENALEFINQSIGTSLLKKRILQLADLADSQTRKRKLPDGEDPFWWNRDWEALASLLRKLTET